MKKSERFKRMDEVEGQVEKLVEKGWNVRQIIYDDEANEPMYVKITLSIDGRNVRDGVI